jgi:hypothetical protein
MLNEKMIRRAATPSIGHGFGVNRPGTHGTSTPCELDRSLQMSPVLHTDAVSEHESNDIPFPASMSKHATYFFYC